jgi:hypothetical protein
MLIYSKEQWGRYLTESKTRKPGLNFWSFSGILVHALNPWPGFLEQITVHHDPHRPPYVIIGPSYNSKGVRSLSWPIPSAPLGKKSETIMRKGFLVPLSNPSSIS